MEGITNYQSEKNRKKVIVKHEIDVPNKEDLLTDYAKLITMKYDDRF